MNLKRKSNLSSVVLILTGGLFLALAALGFSRPTSVSGTGDFLFTVFDVKYPANAGSRIDNCTLCHVNIGLSSARNSYGTAVEENGFSEAALTAVENLDSDGDGWTNLQEIHMHTFPGNASDHPFRFFIPLEQK